MAYKNTMISLGMIAVIGLTAWTALLLSYRPLQSAPASNTTNLPDSFMEDVNAVIMNKYGKPSMKIVTPKLIHFASQNATQLISPQITLYRESPKPWYITSKYAKAINGIDQINFWQNVAIHHAADANNPATFIKTSTLTVYPDKKTAETRDFITMTQPNITIRAVGMTADMNTGNIKLLSQARGEYAPSQ